MEFSRSEYWSGYPFPSPGELPNPGIKPRSPALQADSLPTETQGKPRLMLYLDPFPIHQPGTHYMFKIHKYCAKPLQSSLTLCDPMDHSLPESSVHGIFQARILEWVAMPSSRGSSQPKDGTLIFYISCIGRQVLYH